MKLSIHQSQYIPWPAYFKKIALSDKFIILDDVQFQKNGVQNRNKLRNKNGEFWLTIPVKGSLGDSIKDKEIAHDKWKKKHFQSMSQSYSKSPFWDSLKDEIAALYSQETTKLNDINIFFIKFIISKLEIDTEIIISSNEDFSGKKSDLILNICSKFNASKYLSGTGAKDYLDIDSFKKKGIIVEFMESLPAIYTQIHGEFMPGLSIIDMMMNTSSEEIRKYLYEEN